MIERSFLVCIFKSIQIPNFSLVFLMDGSSGHSEILNNLGFGKINIFKRLAQPSWCSLDCV